MTYSSRTRDGYRLGVTAATGLAVAATVTATGWLAGVAADAPSADTTSPSGSSGSAGSTSGTDDTGVPRTVVRHRPTGVKITNRYVTQTGSVSVGGGGTVVTSPGTPAPAAPPAAPPPPPAAPAPAPSSGS